MIMECNGVLVAMDQHAADERVHLEDLRDRLLAAVDAGVGRWLPPSDAAQPPAGLCKQPVATAMMHGSHAAAAVAAAANSSSTAGTQADQAAAAALRIPVSEHAEALASETCASSPSCSLSKSEWYLYEAYRDHVERCARCHL